MTLRILAVDDFEPWRRFVSSALERQLGLQTLLQASDGLEAVHLAADLHPDIVLLDIGLPKLDGIKTASRIRGVSPKSKILFLSEENSPDVAEEALAVGGAGYVVKSDAGRELLAAVTAVSEGKRYISARLVGHVLFGTPEASISGEGIFHELQIYSNDAEFLDGFSLFAASALNAGSAVMVVAVEGHRQALFQRLRDRGFDLEAATTSGSYICVDAEEFLSSILVDDQPDPQLLESAVSRFVTQAAKAPNGANRRVFACGEGAPFLWAQGKVDAALRLEELWDTLSQRYELSTLCGYILGSFREQQEEELRSLQAVHSVHPTVIRQNHTAS